MQVQFIFTEVLDPGACQHNQRGLPDGQVLWEVNFSLQSQYLQPFREWMRRILLPDSKIWTRGGFWKEGTPRSKNPMKDLEAHTEGVWGFHYKVFALCQVPEFKAQHLQKCICKYRNHFKVDYKGNSFQINVIIVQNYLLLFPHLTAYITWKVRPCHSWVGSVVGNEGSASRKGRLADVSGRDERQDGCRSRKEAA